MLYLLSAVKCAPDAARLNLTFASPRLLTLRCHVRCHMSNHVLRLLKLIIN